MMDMFDDDLREIMGDRYDDGDTQTEMPAMECKRPASEAVKPEPKKSEAVDAEYVSYPKKTRNTMDKLKAAATWLCVCGGISVLMWWFWMNGMMIPNAAYFCIWLSSIVGAFGVAWSVK